MTTPTETTEIIEPENKLPSVQLGDLTDRMQAAVARAGWPSLMPVQSKALAYLMAGQDLMVQSRTGSGKTGAFILPLLERLNLLSATTQALVLTPTRELARQVADEAAMLGRDAGMTVAAIYGGRGYKEQIQALRDGAHVVVGTPGRILDHLSSGRMRFDALRMLVFDEADRMLSMGFYPDMKEIQRYLPEHRVETHMFSATFPPHVMRLARVFMHEPEFLSLSRDHIHVTDVDHIFYTVKGLEKDRTLVKLIEIDNPESAIVFCNTKTRVEYVTVVLRRFGYNADMLTSDLEQNQRERILQRMRDGQLRFLVATDLAARGLDIPELSHVFQYEPPEDPEQYIHRAGRTGRAGASGKAITLVDVLERMRLRRIAQQYSIDFDELTPPTDAEESAVVGARAEVILDAQRRVRDKLKAERMLRFIPLVQQMAQDEDGVTLLAMLVDDVYHRTTHEPPIEIKSEMVQKQQAKRRRKRRG